MSEAITGSQHHLVAMIGELRSTADELAAVGEAELRLRAELSELGSRRAHIHHKRNHILEQYAKLKQEVSAHV